MNAEAQHNAPSFSGSDKGVRLGEKSLLKQHSS